MKSPAKPRSYTAKGIAAFAKTRTKRARALLAEVGAIYADVDGFLETKAEELIAELDELDRNIDGAVIEGRDLT